ncbi:MAG: hypothetical protein AAF668_03700 [Pseudomonadota bacterium]
MEIMPVTGLALLFCVLTFARPIKWGLPIFGVSLALKTASAVNLTSVGGASVLIGQLVLIALVGGFAFRPDLRRDAIVFAQRNKSILLIGAFAVYGTLTAIFMPRIFEGAVNVVSLERNASATATLQPNTGNITQSAYLLSEIFVVWIIAYVVNLPGGVIRATRMINAFTVAHLLFALIDAAPGSAAFMEFLRTANYEIHSTHTVAGMRRWIGSYSEAAAFGGASVVVFSYNFVRFVQTRGTWFLVASTLSLLCTIASLSSTAYVTLGFMGGVWGLSLLWSLMARSGQAREHKISAVIAFFSVLLLIVSILIDPVREFALDMFDRLIGTKLSSDSGIERSSWNRMAIQNAVDTYGLGVGLGGARASSLVTALLSNTGIFGAMLFVAFLLTTILRKFPSVRQADADAAYIFQRRIFSASRAAILAGLFSSIVSGTTVDIGPTCFCFAGIAAGLLAANRRSARERRRSSGMPVKFVSYRDITPTPRFLTAR